MEYNKEFFTAVKNEEFLDWCNSERIEWPSLAQKEFILLHKAFQGGQLAGYIEKPKFGFAPLWGKKKIQSCESVESSPGDLFTMQEFIDYCQSKGFIDYDGFGYYSDGEKFFSDYVIKPSQVISERNIRNFSHVLWYNR